MKKKRIRILTGMLFTVMFLNGCSIGGNEVVITSGVSSRDVFKIGGDSCNIKEAKVYLANYQNIYGKSYGIDLWEQNFQKQKLEKYVKDVALSEMTKIVCMDLLAKDQSISLTQDEVAEIEKAAEVYYSSLNKEEKDYMGVSQADIVSMYKDYALADKVYRALTQSVNEEVSDDEARIMEAMQIYVSDKSKAEEVSAKLKSGEDFAAVANNYNQKTVIEIAFGRGEMPKEVEDTAFELEDGEISDCIAADDGYYFIKCTNKFNVELTDANKSNIVEARENAAFDDVYEEFVSGLASNLNPKVWDSIELVTDGSITTDSYFEVINEIISPES